MMDIDIGCRFVFDVPAPVHTVLLVEPHTSESARVESSSMKITPGRESVQYIDSFGNRCRRFTMGAGIAQIEFSATVAHEGAIDARDDGAVVRGFDHLPHDVFQFLLPSRYCESDQLIDVAWAEFGSLPHDLAQVQAVSDWVHGQVRFDYGSSSPSHSAASVLAGRVGVCRDFTHLAIGMCRALNIPARYVFGYLPDIDVPDPGSPMDFCAWMEVYVGDRWYTFDPRNNQRRVGRVVIGRGRDAADVAMVTTFGAATLVEMTVVAEKSSVHTGVTSA